MGLNHEKGKVKVSIGLPVYNGERFIRNTLNSILSQTFTDFELIISDNASTDATKAICEEYAAKDKRIRYVRQPITVLAIDNFVKVLENAQANCFMWIPHDDYYEQDNYISALFEKMREGYTFAFPNSNIVRVDSDGHIIQCIRDVYRGLHRSDGTRYEMSKDFTKVYGLYCYGMQFYGMYKTDRLREMIVFLRKYSKRFFLFSEGSFLHRIFSSEDCTFVEAVYFNYVIHGKNISAGVKPPQCFIAYLNHTFNVFSTYLLSSFSVSEKISILSMVAIIHYYKLCLLGAASMKYYFLRLLELR